MIFITFLFKYTINLIIIIIDNAHSNDLNKSSKILKSHDRLKKLIIIKLDTTAVILRNIVLKKSFAELSYHEFNISIIDSSTITLTRLKIMISSKSLVRLLLIEISNNVTLRRRFVKLIIKNI